jgi:arsenite/tail-anchored protein-transporting ATPase
LAAATAVHDARAGLRVLLVSTDQAHSLGDVLGVVVSPTGGRDAVRVLADLETGAADAGGGFLDALALDTLALLEARWRTVVDTLGRRFGESELGVVPQDDEPLEGGDELLFVAVSEVEEELRQLMLPLQ